VGYRTSEAQRKMRVASDAAAIYSIRRKNILIDSHAESGRLTTYLKTPTPPLPSSSSSSFAATQRRARTSEGWTRMMREDASGTTRMAMRAVHARTKNIDTPRGSSLARLNEAARLDTRARDGLENGVCDGARASGNAPKADAVDASVPARAAVGVGSVGAARISRSAPAGSVPDMNGDHIVDDRMVGPAMRCAAVPRGDEEGCVRRRTQEQRRTRGPRTAHPSSPQRLHTESSHRHRDMNVCGRSLSSRSSESGTQPPSRREESDSALGHRPTSRLSAKATEQGWLSPMSLRGPGRASMMATDLSKLCLLPAGRAPDDQHGDPLNMNISGSPTSTRAKLNTKIALARARLKHDKERKGIIGQSSYHQSRT